VLPGAAIGVIDGTLSPSDGLEDHMPWWNAFGFGRQPLPAPVPEPVAVTAAAAMVKGPQSQFLQHTQEWQSEAWQYYDSLGEFNTAAWWLANMLSRVRLRAARLDPGLDEPTIVSDGVAAEIVGSLGGGVGGQANIMRSLALQLTVPGDCYLIGEGDLGAEAWTVRSVDEVRAQNGKFQTITDRTPNITWTDLPPGSLPVRIWRPHARFYHLADSTSRAALPIMRELELVNRHITAQYLSRLASAGVLVLPEEVTFPVRAEFEDAPDPFTAEWIEIAAEAIRTPGTASAVIPIPIKVPAEFVDKIKHIDFTLRIDEKVIEKRESAIHRLANKLDIPAEVLTGLSAVNHWTAWQLDEGALKTHIAPTSEAICDSLTRGYLHPRLKASGEDPAKWVVWYDMSELANRPDKSENARDAYDRLELSGKALRREGGFDEDDAPKSEELQEQALKIIIRTVANAAPAALDALLGKKVLEVAVSPPASGTPAPPAEEPAPPPEKGAEPGPPAKEAQPAPPEKAQVRADRIGRQVKALHAIRFHATSPGGVLLHPPLCADHSYSCPFTHAAWSAVPAHLTTGTYECRLDPFGQFIVGRQAPELDTSEWIPTRGFSPARKGKRHDRALV
jgi:hypothetical protein